MERQQQLLIDKLVIIKIVVEQWFSELSGTMFGCLHCFVLWNFRRWPFNETRPNTVSSSCPALGGSQIHRAFEKNIQVFVFEINNNL